MAIRFEFDSANKILLIRVEGPLTNQVLAECYDAIRKYSTETDASAGIFDFSSVTEFPVSTELIRRLAKREPAMPNATSRPRILVAPQQHAFGLIRMFQILGESTRPMLQVAHSLDESVQTARRAIPTLRTAGLTSATSRPRRQGGQFFNSFIGTPWVQRSIRCYQAPVTMRSPGQKSGQFCTLNWNSWRKIARLR
jgi:hypothetical protein